MITAIRGRIFAYGEPTDMRKSFNSLSAIVSQKLGQDPASGDLFLFVNKRCNRAKVLHFDGTGMAIYMKRMEKARFAAPWKSHQIEDGRLSLTASELSIFLEGSPLVFMGRIVPEHIRPQKIATHELVVR